MSQYTSDTQVELKDFIFNTRQISLDKIGELLKSEKPKNGFCQRCGSDKIFNYDVVFSDSTFKRLSQYEWKDLKANSFQKDQIECFVCGHIVEKPNETYIYKILKSLKGN